MASFTKIAALEKKFAGDIFYPGRFWMFLIWGKFAPGRFWMFLIWGDLVPVRFCPGEILSRGDYKCEDYVRGDFFLRRFCSWEIMGGNEESTIYHTIVKNC